MFLADFEYELVNIIFEQPYELSEDDITGYVAENATTPSKDEEITIEYDADGLPMGRSKEEIEIRRQIVYDYIQRWRTENKDNPHIYNDNLKEYIKITQIFMIESVAHSVGNYKSTKAILHFEEIMAKAHKVGLTRTKEGNRNQKPFTKMMVMRYKMDDLGDIKMTVGIRARTNEKVEYSITVPDKEKPFIDKNLRIHSKSKKRKKRSK